MKLLLMNCARSVMAELELCSVPQVLRRERMKTGLWQIAFCLALLLGWLSPIYGQSKLGRLVLVLTDEIGAVVPGVEIQIDSAQTHVSQKTISDANGEAVLRGRPFWAYTI